MNQIRFSLLIPCLSSPEVLSRTLDGIKGQSFDPLRTQVIVIDDCSDPPLSETFEAFQAQSEALSVYLRNGVNLGRAASRNRGLSAAQGAIVVFMDVDQLLDPTFLTVLDKAFGESPRQSIRANTAVWPPLLGESAYLRFYDMRFLGKRLRELEKYAGHGLPPKYYATGCMATGTEALQEAGGFDESFNRYGCEDEELGVRLDKLGVKLSFSQEAKSYSTDHDLTPGKACRRLIDYARYSVPLILAKHPDYLPHTVLPLLEASPDALSLKKRILRRTVLSLFRPALAERLLRYLESRDGKSAFNPPARLYQAALLGFYLIGVRARMGDGGS